MFLYHDHDRSRFLALGRPLHRDLFAVSRASSQVRHSRKLTRLKPSSSFYSVDSVPRQRGINLGCPVGCHRSAERHEFCHSATIWDTILYRADLGLDHLDRALISSGERRHPQLHRDDSCAKGTTLFCGESRSYAVFVFTESYEIRPSLKEPLVPVTIEEPQYNASERPPSTVGVANRA